MIDHLPPLAEPNEMSRTERTEGRVREALERLGWTPTDPRPTQRAVADAIREAGAAPGSYRDLGPAIRHVVFEARLAAGTLVAEGLAADESFWRCVYEHAERVCARASDARLRREERRWLGERAAHERTADHAARLAFEVERLGTVNAALLAQIARLEHTVGSASDAARSAGPEPRSAR